MKIFSTSRSGLLKVSNELQLLAGVLAASQSLFLSVFHLFDKKKEFGNVLLGVYFLAISLRIVKSVLWVYVDTTPLWLINLGFFAHAISAPVLLLYCFSFVFQSKWSHWNFLHIAPCIILLINVNVLTLEGFWYQGAYSILLIYQLVYTLGAVAAVGIGLIIYRDKIGLRKADWIWIMLLVSGTLFLQLAYFSNYILGLTPYLLGPIIYAAFIYFISFFAWRNPQIFKTSTVRKYKHIRVSEKNLQHYLSKIHLLMKSEHPYLDSDYTIKQLASRLNVPTYLLSYLLNEGYSKSFPEFINGYRIEKAKALLSDPEFHHIKISNVAYECGFNSLSSFNAAFKNNAGQTPSQYKKETLTDL